MGQQIPSGPLNVEGMMSHMLQEPGLERKAEARAQAGHSRTSGMPLQKAQSIPCRPRGVAEAQPKRAPTAEGCRTAEEGYLQGCIEGKVFPRLVRTFLGEAPTLDLDSQYLVDSELEAVLCALNAPHGCKDGRQKAQPVTELAMGNNPGLSDPAMAHFLSSALLSSSSRVCIGPLKRLSLACCTGLGEVTMCALAGVLHRGVDLLYLEELDLSNVPIPAVSWPQLASGLQYACHARRLLLANTSCGRQTQASCTAVAQLAAGRSLRRLEILDLSGNHFLDEGCRALGLALRSSTDSLQELDLSHNAGLTSVMFATEEASNPIMHVLEVLGETTLKKASFANCQLAYMEDCVLEASIPVSEITDLDISDNPHGEMGLRCLVRLLACARSELHLELREARVHPSNGSLTYDYTHPTNAYRLCLESVQHRSVLRLLLKRCEEVTGSTRCSLFTKACLDGAPLRAEGGLQHLCFKREDRGGNDWQVPDRGVLTFFFDMPSIYEEGEDLDGVYTKFQRRQKLCTSLASFARIIQVYKGLKDQQSQKIFLESMSWDLCLKVCQLKQLAVLSQSYLLPFILGTLLPETMQLPPRSYLFDLTVCCSKGWPADTAIKMAMECRSLVFFNPLHPDGHYELNMEVPADRGTAQRCMVLSRWIGAYCSAWNRLDLSEFGDRDCMWHAVHDGRHVRSISTEWQLKARGSLAFDFVLPRLSFGRQGTAEEPATLRALGEALGASCCRFTDRLHALRAVAHQLVLRPDQLQEALEWFPAWEPKCARKAYFEENVNYILQPRAEAYIFLYNRTLHHSEVVSPRLLYNTSLLHEEEIHTIRKRMGMTHTFDAMNLHDSRSNLGNRHGPLDLATWEGFTILRVMVAITTQEPSVNFHKGLWSEQAAFYERGFAFILPAAWIESPPRIGHFTATFASKDDEVSPHQRMKVARRLLGWTFPDPADGRRSPPAHRHPSLALRALGPVRAL